MGAFGVSACQAGAVTDVVRHHSAGACSVPLSIVRAAALSSLWEYRRAARETPRPQQSDIGPDAPIPPDGPFVEIPVSGGKAMTLVDPSAVALVSRHRWHLSGGGYARASVAGKSVLLHRLILAAPDGVGVDHRSGDRLDNRRANLRFATRSENARNCRARDGGTSRFKGVSRNSRTGLFDAYIHFGGRHINLGSFGCEELAARLYDAAARDHFGEFARLNLPGRMLP